MCKIFGGTDLVETHERGRQLPSDKSDGEKQGSDSLEVSREEVMVVDIE